MPPAFSAAARVAGLFLFLGAGLLAPITGAETAEPARLAAKSLLLDVTRAGYKLVAVGDRGHVLLSADEGRTWSQVVTPTRAMLTGVAFADASHGWAVGHDGTILASADGGQTWSRADDGRDLETVFLDVCFLDAKTGFIVGAYGKFLRTDDGGRTWQPSRPHAEETHYNRIVAAEGRLYLAGEAGLLLTSADRGRTWQPIALPYEGSLFAVVPLENDRAVVAGLRGHILVGSARGGDWSDKDGEIKALVSGGARLPSGLIVLGGQGGNFFLSRDDGETFTPWKPADLGAGVADLIATTDGAVLAVGEAGAVRVTPP